MEVGTDGRGDKARKQDDSICDVSLEALIRMGWSMSTSSEALKQCPSLEAVKLLGSDHGKDDLSKGTCGSISTVINNSDDEAGSGQDKAAQEEEEVAAGDNVLKARVEEDFPISVSCIRY